MLKALRYLHAVPRAIHRSGQVAANGPDRRSGPRGVRPSVGQGRSRRPRGQARGGAGRRPVAATRRGRRSRGGGRRRHEGRRDGGRAAGGRRSLCRGPKPGRRGQAEAGVGRGVATRRDHRRLGRGRRGRQRVAGRRSGGRGGARKGGAGWPEPPISEGPPPGVTTDAGGETAGSVATEGGGVATDADETVCGSCGVAPLARAGPPPGVGAAAGDGAAGWGRVARNRIAPSRPGAASRRLGNAERKHCSATAV